MTSASLMDEARHSQSVLWDNLEGWGGEGGGRGFRMPGRMCTLADSGQGMAKTITIL